MDSFFGLVATCVPTVTFVCASFCGPVHAGSFAALAPGGAQGDDRLSVIYNALTGEVAVESPESFLSVQIDSEAGIFTEDSPRLGGDVEILEPDRQLFMISVGPNGLAPISSWSFGTPAQRGLSEQFVSLDLTVWARAAATHEIQGGDLIYIAVPEPSPFILMLAGLVVLTIRRQHRPTAGCCR